MCCSSIMDPQRAKSLATPRQEAAELGYSKTITGALGPKNAVHSKVTGRSLLGIYFSDLRPINTAPILFPIRAQLVGHTESALV
jgi:hypothetical protein